MKVAAVLSANSFCALSEKTMPASLSKKSRTSSANVVWAFTAALLELITKCKCAPRRTNPRRPRRSLGALPTELLAMCHNACTGIRRGSSGAIDSPSDFSMSISIYLYLFHTFFINTLCTNITFLLKSNEHTLITTFTAITLSAIGRFLRVSCSPNSPDRLQSCRLSMSIRI